MKANIGDKVRDRITGFQGIVVSRSEWLNGCTRLGVQSQTLKDGVPGDVVWLDEPQVELVETCAISAGPRDKGGPIASKPTRW